MFYVLEHILLCLLAAALLGGLIAWLVRGMGFGSRLSELEADWRRKLGFAEDERTKVAAQLKTSEGALADWRSRFAKLETEHGSLKTSFADVSGKIPVLEAAVAGWVAKSALWDTAKAKLEADLKACAAACSKLELQLADWTMKAKAWDTDRADMTARASAAAATYEKSLADLRAQVPAMQGQLKTVQGERDQLRAALDRLTAEQKSTAAEMQALHGRLNSSETGHKSALAEIATLVGSAKLLQSERDKAAAEISELENKIVTLHADAGNLQGQLKAAHAERDKVIGEYRGTNAQLEEAIHKLRTELTSAHGERDRAIANDADYERTITDLKARLASIEIENGNWKSRIAELEARQAAPLAMAAAAGAGTVPDTRYTKLQDQFHSFVVRTQKEGYGDIERIEGIGPVYGQKLRSIGIAWVKELLEEGASAVGRQRIADESGIDRNLILTWVNHADLLRIEGVSPDWAELLEVSGVDTVKELRNRVPENLHRKMEETNPTNPQGRYAPTVPDLEMVRGWVEIAKSLTPKVTH